MHSKSLTLVAALFCGAVPASADFVNVYGGPTYTLGVGGFKDGYVTGVNDAGVAIGTGYKFDASDVDLGERAFRWDATAASELGNLGTDVGGVGYGSPIAINDFGMVIGVTERHDASGEFMGVRAVRWEASGTVATELSNLGTDGDGYTWSGANAINDAGVIVGNSDLYDGSGEWLGERAVRWDSPVAAATELESLGTGTNGFIGSSALSINNSNTAVGYAAKHDNFDQSLGVRAVRWDAAGTAVTELGNLGTDPDGYTYNVAEVINDVGTAAGGAEKYNSSGEYLGYVAVRWVASSTVPTELGNLGTDADGITYTGVYAINDAGTIVGYADRYNGSGEYLDNIAVRWDASGTAATVLGNLGTDPDGLTDSTAFDVNNAGIAVGYAAHYDGSGALFGDRAAYWDRDGVAVNLNTLIDPLSGWTLEYANFISNTGWIAGSGTFDPDGPGGQEAYSRLFLIQIPALAFLPGDYNRDGAVDAADYVVWRNSPSTFSGDPEGYNTWRTHFGQTTGVGATFDSAANHVVPEPTSFSLLVLASAALPFRHFRDSRTD